MIRSQKPLLLFLVAVLAVSCTDNIKNDKNYSLEKNSSNSSSEVQLKDSIKVAFLIYPEMAVLDMTGPMDAFIKINRMTENQYEVYTVSASTAIIKTQGHIIETKADYTFENAPKPDILIVPGAKIDIVLALADKPNYAKYIKEQSKNAEVTMSVCTGSFALGKLGLLNGKKATTHWILGDKFEKDFNSTKLVRDVRYVQDENIITTSGVATGIDGALAIISEYSGPNFAGMASRALQYETKIKEPWPAMSTKPMKHGDSEPRD